MRDTKEVVYEFVKRITDRQFENAPEEKKKGFYISFLFTISFLASAALYNLISVVFLLIVQSFGLLGSQFPIYAMSLLYSYIGAIVSMFWRYNNNGQQRSN